MYKKISVPIFSFTSGRIRKIIIPSRAEIKDIPTVK
jgi:hypothetical protein